MSKNYMQEIKSRILASEDGSVFSTSDFADIADTNTVRSALYRLVKDNILRRIINGIYEKPKYSKLLDEYVAADPAAVAQALARSYHWTIAPCGNIGGASDQCGVTVENLLRRRTVDHTEVDGLPRYRELYGLGIFGADFE